MAVSADKRAWVQQILGVTVPEAPAPQAGGGDAKAALAGWQKAREAAIGQLRQLESAIAGMKHPKGNAAIILVKAIQKNLTAAPDSRRSVGELQRYLETDDIIGEAERKNGFGITVSLRQPLLAALKPLETALPA